MDQSGRSIAEHCGKIEEPRVERIKRHSLPAIITIALCGVMCGADSWVEIAELGWAREAWYRSFLWVLVHMRWNRHAARPFLSHVLERVGRARASS